MSQETSKSQISHIGTCQWYESGVYGYFLCRLNSRPFSCVSSPVLRSGIGPMFCRVTSTSSFIGLIAIQQIQFDQQEWKQLIYRLVYMIVFTKQRFILKSHSVRMQCFWVALVIRLNNLLTLKVWRVVPSQPRCFNSFDSTLQVSRMYLLTLIPV